MGNEPLSLVKQGRKRFASQFYPIQLPFAYRAYKRGRLIHSGLGVTLEISSGGVKLKTWDSVPCVATDIDVSIPWPVHLVEGAGLECLIQGKPIWDGFNLSAIRILRYEFLHPSRQQGIGLAGRRLGRQRNALDFPRPSRQPARIFLKGDVS